MNYRNISKLAFMALAMLCTAAFARAASADEVITFGGDTFFSGTTQYELCLTVANTSTPQGSSLSSDTCALANQGNGGSQEFSYNNGGLTWTSSGGSKYYVTANSSTGAVTLTSTPPTPDWESAGGFLVWTDSAWGCMEVTGGSTNSGTGIDLATETNCTGSEGQSFWVGSGTSYEFAMRNYALGTCIQEFYSYRLGAYYEMEACSGTADQTFYLNSNQQIVNAGTGNCVTYLGTDDLRPRSCGTSYDYWQIGWQSGATNGTPYAFFYNQGPSVCLDYNTTYSILDANTCNPYGGTNPGGYAGWNQ